MPLVSIPDFEKRLGRAVTSAEIPRATSAIDDATDLVRDEAKRDFSDGVPGSIIRVILAVALRDFRNPEGASSDTETIGPFTRTRSYKESSLYLTEEEKRIVRRFRRNNSGLWTLRTTRDDWPYYDDDMYLFPDDGTEPLLVGFDIEE